MQLVVDANVIIAMLLKPGKPINLFFKEELEIFAPELLLKELEANKGEIQNRSCLDSKDIQNLLFVLRQKIIFIPEEEFVAYRELATKICPDPKDVAYFALALHLHCQIWTNEQLLRNQQEIKIYATHELMQLFRMS